MNKPSPMSWKQFHQLWSECVGTPSYDKTAWKSIENQLERNGLLTQGVEPPTIDEDKISKISMEAMISEFNKFGLLRRAVLTQDGDNLQFTAKPTFTSAQIRIEHEMGIDHMEAMFANLIEGPIKEQLRLLILRGRALAYEISIS